MAISTRDPATVKNKLFFGVEPGISNMADIIVCPQMGCTTFPSQPVGTDPQQAAAALFVHTLAAHSIPGQGAQRTGVRAPALIRPSIDIGCTPAQWADFLSQWGRFYGACDITPAQAAAQCTACFSDELVNTADKAIANMRSLNIDELLTRVKAIAVKRVSVGIRRSNAHNAKQAAGESFMQFVTKVRGLIVDCNYVYHCPHAPAPAAGVAQRRNCDQADCAGSDYASAVERNILLAGVYDPDILGTADIEEMPIDDIIELVELKEAARDATGVTKPAAAAATSSYKKPQQRPTAETALRLRQRLR